MWNMTHPRNHGAEELAALLSALRLSRCLDRVDVQMARARMADVPFQDLLECGDDFFGTGLRITRARPLIPWAEHHHRFGKEGVRVEILSVTAGHHAHRIGVCAVETWTVGSRRHRDITYRHRFNECLLDCICAALERQRLLC